MEFEFRCQTCGEIHNGMPGFGAIAPLSYYVVPEAERTSRCVLGTDECVIDRASFLYVVALEFRCTTQMNRSSGGAWASLSEKNFNVWRSVFDEQHRSHVGPFFGWLNAWLKPYPETMNLKSRLHLRDNGLRPRIELEPTDHPLAVEQRNGISVDRVAEIYAIMMHGSDQ